MRKNFGPKPYLYPQPVLIIATYWRGRDPRCHERRLGRDQRQQSVSLCI